MKQIISIVMVIIGALVGAGFASGQEVYLFFYKYGIYGIATTLISSVLISFCIYKVLLAIKKSDINNYKEFLMFFLDNSDSKILNIANNILNILLLITFFIMVSGFGAYFEQEYKISSLIGSGILAILCFIVFIRDVDGFIKISKYIVPILIIFILFIGILNVSNIKLEKINYDINIKNIWYGLISGIIYASYNLILLVPVLLTLKDNIKKENKIKYITIFSGIIIFLLSIVIYFLLINISGNIENIEMPAVYVMRKKFKYLTNCYGFIILISIFTTAISLGISFLENVTKNKRSYTQIASIMCITSVIFSKIGFSNLIKILYPLFGLLGFIQIYIILKKHIEKNIKN